MNITLINALLIQFHNEWKICCLTVNGDSVRWILS